MQRGGSCETSQGRKPNDLLGGALVLGAFCGAAGNCLAPVGGRCPEGTFENSPAPKAFGAGLLSWCPSGTEARLNFRKALPLNHIMAASHGQVKLQEPIPPRGRGSNLCSF